MTTEVRIKKSRSYLPYLRKIVSCTAAGLGMNRKDIEATERAVSEVCIRAMDSTWSREDGSLSIKLASCGTYMTVEITDPSVRLGPVESGQWVGSNTCPYDLDGLLSLADKVEFSRGDGTATVLITKYAGKLETAAAPVAHLAFFGTSGLQA